MTKNAGKQRVGGWSGRVERSFRVAIELQELREQREDEGKGYLRQSVRQRRGLAKGSESRGHTKSSSSETKITFKTRLRVAASTGAIPASFGDV